MTAMGIISLLTVCSVLSTICAATVPGWDLGPESERLMRLWATSGARFPLGDPRRCLDILRSDGERPRRFEVLPGLGWDNLQNVDQGQVVSHNFSLCKTTEDGRFLLPDSVTAVPVKSSRVETFAELIHDYTEWTSADSKTVNVAAGGLVRELSINGKFSWDYQDVKKKQVTDNSVTTRAQIRYVRYAVQLQPDTALHPVFRGRLLDMAAAHELNNTEHAQYLAQLLVRDYGTHVITGAEAGAALLKVDQVNGTFVQQNLDKKTSILASASLSLFGVFGLSSTTIFNTDNSLLTQYQAALTASSVSTMGGPIYQPVNFTINEWASQMDRDLVALDRSGFPLNFIITATALPEVPASTVREVAASVARAVERYYKFNSVPGCQDRTSPNFSPGANVDDGSCVSAVANLTFGGVYQTCQMMQGSDNGDLCGGLHQKNPLSGDYSCPEGHQPVLLHSGSVKTSSVDHSCNKFWFVKYNCKDTYRQSVANYSAFWCVARQEALPDSGYLFGGLYTSHSANPVTQQASCPPHFRVVRVGARADLHVCVSDDYAQAADHSVPFGGFTSCVSGNPLAVAHVSAGNTSSNASIPWVVVDINSTDASPHGCPRGYSQHLATVDNDCDIDYCVPTNALRAPVTPPIKRPPFHPAPPLRPPARDNQVVFDQASRQWLKSERAAAYSSMVAALNASGAASEYQPEFLVSNTDFRSWLQVLQARAFNMTMRLANQGGPPSAPSALAGSPPLSATSTSLNLSVSPAFAAGIAVVATLAGVLLVVLGVMAAQAYRRRGRGGYSRHDDVTSVKG